MARLIDAEWLLRLVCGRKCGCEPEMCGCEDYHECEIGAYIKESPTVDAVPVVRGEWIHGCRDGAGTEFCYCSVCDEDAPRDKGGYTEFSTYCPNCGAKMDGKDGAE